MLWYLYHVYTMAALVSLTTSVSFLECTGTGRWSASSPRVGGTRAKPVAGFRGYVRGCHHTKGCVTMINRVALGLHCFRVVIVHHRVCYTRKENTIPAHFKTAICLAKILLLKLYLYFHLFVTSLAIIIRSK